MNYHLSSSARRGQAPKQPLPTTTTALVPSTSGGLRNRYAHAETDTGIIRNREGIDAARATLAKSIRNLQNHFTQAPALPSKARGVCSSIRDDILVFADLVKTLAESHRASSRALRAIILPRNPIHPVPLRDAETVVNEAIQAITKARASLNDLNNVLPTRSISLENAMNETPGRLAEASWAVADYKLWGWSPAKTAGNLGITASAIGSAFGFTKVQNAWFPSIWIGFGFALGATVCNQIQSLGTLYPDKDAWQSIDLGRGHMSEVSQILSSLEVTFRSLYVQWDALYSQELDDKLEMLRSEAETHIIPTCDALNQQAAELDEVMEVLTQHFAIIPPASKRITGGKAQSFLPDMV